MHLSGDVKDPTVYPNGQKPMTIIPQRDNAAIVPYNESAAAPPAPGIDDNQMAIIGYLGVGLLALILFSGSR